MWGRLILALGILTALWIGPTTAVAATAYHVSYLWTHDLDGARTYKTKVGRVLGRGVARSLRVVADGKLYGVVYLRRGGSTGATKAAKTHTRLLRKAGLEAAAPVRNRAWTVLDAAPARSAKKKVRKSIAATKASYTQRAAYKSPGARSREIRDVEAAVEAYIEGLRRSGRLSADERTGWSVYDFTTGEKLVTINENVQFQAASLIKPFVATAFFHRVKSGDLIYGPKSRRHMHRMIHYSKNGSTNWVMRQVGGPAAVQKILTEHYPAIFQDTRIVEYIPGGGQTYRNKASVHDYSRFLHALWNKGIPGAKEIQRLMALPGSDRLYTGARDVPKGTRVYNKTGSTARLCGDMGILIVKGPDGKRYPYTLIGVIEKRSKAPNYTTWIRSRGDIIRNVSNIVYRGIATRHAFDNVL